MSGLSDAWLWLLGLGTIGIFSFIFGENPVYRFCEHVYVGVAGGYSITVAYQNLINQAWKPITLDGKLMLIIPIVLGLMAYTRFFKGIAYLSRWPMALLAGVGAGLSLFGVTNADLVAQIKANLLPLFKSGMPFIGNTTNGVVENFVMVFGVLAVLIYFFFAIDHKGPIKPVAGAGRYLLMITFGVSFGNVVAGRISLLLGCLQDVLGKWLGLLTI